MELLKRDTVTVDDMVTTLVYRIEGNSFHGHDLEVSANGLAVYVRLIKYHMDAREGMRRVKVSVEVHTFEEFLERVAPLVLRKAEIQEENAGG